ncbi:DUF927 domain-containing protein [Methylocaldum szegediense]|uniref:DUF927 domain-containing protein n=1 Tax=Methylocaldum szegediense TaxID=73780 RepID=UPI0003F84B70|nr:DUF927 domain-containing protein [Methylocaldum szegediense]
MAVTKPSLELTQPLPAGSAAEAFTADRGDTQSQSAGSSTAHFGEAAQGRPARSRKGTIPPTAANVRAALSYLSPDCDRDTWVSIGMAVKDALGDAGFELFDAWSRDGQSYRPADCRDTWKSIKPGGATTVATLWRLALDAGWRPDGEAHEETEAERQARERERARRAEREAADRAKKARAAERKTAELARIVVPAGENHPYLIRKGVKPTETLFEIPADRLATAIGYAPKSDDEPLAGRVLVAFVEHDGRRATAEFIDATGRKSALAGGPKSGGYWAAQPLPDGDGAGLVLLLGEGIATVLSAREATGYLAIAALSAANLPKVATALRARYPKARLIVLGDAGKAVKYAEQAAKSTGAALAVPGFTPEQASAFQRQHGKQPTDFNDLGALAGLEVVKQQIRQAERAGTGMPAAKSELPKGFKLTDKGLFFLEEGEDEATDKRKIFVCSPLFVTAETRSKDQTQWGRLLEWNDRDGHAHAWTIPMAMLEGEPSGVCSVLADGGLIIGVGSKSRNLLIRYIKECKPGARVRCVNRIGWHGPVYVLPTQTLGERQGERVLYQNGASGPGDFRQRGSVAEWRESVAKLSAGNSRLMTAIGFAFAAPLLQFVPGEESGGAHFRGDSSCGKSTLLWAAASVYGQPSGDDSFRKEWRATGNGLEGLATSRNDSLLILDEMGQVDGREAGNIAYMLANGQPKLRMADNTGLRKAPSWRLLFLSSGEISLADHMAAAGKTIKAGQENRLADIPAAPFTGFGVFDRLNGYPSGAELSVAIREAAAKYHGAVGIAFIERVAEIQETLPDRLKTAIARFVADVVPRGASGQVDRVAKRFGLVAAAIELAGEFGLTGWDPGEGTWAVKACFADWLHQRGGAGDHEVTAILSQVRAFFEANGESRFSDWEAAERVANSVEDERRVVANRVGFRRRSQTEGYTYYVLPEAFKREVCAGLNPDRAAQVLKEHGWLEPDKQGKSSQNQRLPGFGRQTRCYVFTPKMWEMP